MSHAPPCARYARLVAARVAGEENGANATPLPRRCAALRAVFTTKKGQYSVQKYKTIGI